MYKEVQLLLGKGIVVDGCPVILDVVKSIVEGEDDQRFKAALKALLRAPAVQSVSWGWVLVEPQTRVKKKKIKRTQTTVAWSRRPGRVVLRGLFR